jgi:hypothetical protein
LGSVSKTAYDFWTGPEAEEHFSQYMWGPDSLVEEHPDFKIPKEAELPSYYHMDDLGHESGAFWDDSARLEILEMDGPGYGYEANKIRQIYEGTLGEFIEENEIEDNVTFEELQPDAKYYFMETSMEGGVFDGQTVEIPGTVFDPKKLHFSVLEILPLVGHRFIREISYEGEYFSLSERPDSSSTDFELVGP